jgi:alpha-1,2-mannosyltransferase
MGIFIVQPHKEERFMYVIYPLIYFNAAHAVIAVIALFDTVASSIHISSLSRRNLKSVFLSALAIVYLLLSIARILAQVRAFQAPMHIFSAMESSSTVCLGKEWYRFPSSFLVPEASRPLFVKSAFDGLLPGKFPEEHEIGWRGGTYQIPETMNDRNLEEVAHLV